MTNVEDRAGATASTEDPTASAPSLEGLESSLDDMYYQQAIKDLKRLMADPDRAGLIAAIQMTTMAMLEAFSEEGSHASEFGDLKNLGSLMARVDGESTKSTLRSLTIGVVRGLNLNHVTTDEALALARFFKMYGEAKKMYDRGVLAAWGEALRGNFPAAEVQAESGAEVHGS